jgi:hypothetical protein
MVVITDEGRATLAGRRAARTERLAGIITQLTPAERAALTSALPVFHALASVPREDDATRVTAR